MKVPSMYRVELQLWLRRHSMAWRVSLFIFLFFGLQTTWEALRGSIVERWVIHDAVVAPAARLINTLTPNVGVTAVGASLHAQGGGLNILNGCEGVEVAFLLCAAFAVAPLRIASRVLGTALGILLVYGLNELRILSLFYAYRMDARLFDALHGMVTPIIMVISIGAWFHIVMNFRHARTQ